VSGVVLSLSTPERTASAVSVVIGFVLGTAIVIGYEYKLVQVREGMIGGKMSGDKLERILNDHASSGWQLRANTAVEVKGRIGPGGVEGVLVTFERPHG
jgi:Domain of unknown function (DUF4177)